MAQYKLLNKGYYFQVCGKKKCSNGAAVFERCWTNLLNAYSIHLLPALRFPPGETLPHPAAGTPLSARSMSMSLKHPDLKHIYVTQRNQAIVVQPLPSAQEMMNCLIPLGKKKKKKVLVLCIHCNQKQLQSFFRVPVISSYWYKLHIVWNATEVCTWQCSCLSSWEIIPTDTCVVYRESSTGQTQLLGGLGICCDGQIVRLPSSISTRFKAEHREKEAPTHLAASPAVCGVQMGRGLLNKHLRLLFASLYHNSFFTYPISNPWGYTVVLVMATVC